MSEGAFLSLNGVRVTSGHVSIPYYGTWNATVMMPTGNALAPGTAAALTLGNLTLKGTVYRAGGFSGQVRVMIVGGKGGWMKPVPSQQYVLSGGVKLSTVLNDVATLVGETVQLQADPIIGSQYVREAANAERVLRQIGGSLWYVDTSGVTQIKSKRDPKPVGTPFLVNRYDADRGEFEISTEDYAAWLPGATFSNALVTTPQTVSLTTIDTSNDGKFRFTILTVGPPTDRLLADLRSIIRDEIDELTFLGTYEYAVQNTDGQTVDAYPTGSIPIPDLRQVPIRTGIAGATCKPAIGSLLAVSFLNGDPTRPVVLGVYDSTAAQSSSLSASTITLNGGTGTDEHVCTVEAVTNIIANLLILLSVPASTSASTLAAFLATLSTPATAQVQASLAITAAAAPATGTLVPGTIAAILGALAAKTSDLGGTQPGVGCPNIKAG